MKFYNKKILLSTIFFHVFILFINKDNYGQSFYKENQIIIKECDISNAIGKYKNYNCEIKEELKYLLASVGNLNNQKVLQIQGFQKNEDSAIIFNSSLLTVAIISCKFDINNHKRTFNKKGWLYKLDGAFYWPIEYIATTAIKQIQIHYIKKNKRIILPAFAFKNILHPIAVNSTVYQIKKTGNVYIHMRNGDAAGAYQVIFIISRYKYSGRVIIENCYEL